MLDKRVKAAVHKVLNWLPEKPSAYHLVGSYLRAGGAAGDVDLYLLYEQEHGFMSKLEGKRMINGIRFDLFFFVPPQGTWDHFYPIALREMEAQGWKGVIDTKTFPAKASGNSFPEKNRKP